MKEHARLHISFTTIFLKFKKILLTFLYVLFIATLGKRWPKGPRRGGMVRVRKADIVNIRPKKYELVV